MKKTLILLLLFISSCSLNKIVNHHGVHNLEKKQTKLKINYTNKNDIVQLMGPPSTKSTFDNDIFIYIERKTSSSKLTKFGKKELLTNNVLVLEIDKRGILFKKEFYDLNKMKNIKIVSNETTVDYKKQSFIYEFLSSMRQKINDPLGKRKRD